MSRQKIILVAGPTASGKSRLAMDLARQHNGTIINADAMQIYDGLPILAAQPSHAEQAEIPHLLYGTLSPDKRSSVGHWLDLAQKAIEQALQDKRLPILVGGTGLYFRALLGGLAEIPSIPDSVRLEAMQLYDALGEEKFRHALAQVDPISAAKLARNDRQRMIRAYEVAVHTGRPLPDWHEKGVRAENGDKPLTVALPGLGDVLLPEPHLLLPPRNELYAACDHRFAHMMDAGAEAEARAFLARDLDLSVPAMKTIGLRELGAWFKSEISKDDAITKAQQATRNYAKRQLTWFRNQWPFSITKAEAH